MNVVIYARFSSHSQTEQSIEGQLKECYAYAQRNDYMVVGEYIDRALSGTTDHRPEFQKMIADSSKKTFQGVLVYQLDRFARNRYDSATYKSKLKKNGVRVLSARENISDDASGVLMEAVLEGMAEYYSVELAQKIKRGMDINAEKCLSTGGNVALGFKIEDKRIVIDPVTAPVVVKIFEMYVAGSTMADIIRYLNANHIKTSYGNEFNKNSINRILRNKRYIGTYTYRDTEVPDGLPRIVDDDLFREAQRIMEKNKKAPARAKAKVDYLLTTKLFCGHCKAAMTGVSGTSKTEKKYHYYQCVTNRRDKSCNKKTVNKDYIEDVVVQQLREFLTPDNITTIAKEVVDLCERESNNGNAKRLQKLLAENEKATENLLKALESGQAVEIIAERITQKKKEHDDLSYQLLVETTQHPVPSVRDIRFFLSQFRKGDINDPKYRQGLVDMLVNKIYLYDDKMTILCNTQDGHFDVDLKEVSSLKGHLVVVVELKSPSREETDASAAYRQIRNYMHEIPSLFIYNAVCVMSDLTTSKAGTITSGEDRFMAWKTTDGDYENTQYAQFDTFFEGLFEKRRFLDILKNFICFNVDGEKTFKILAGYHQYFAVKKAVASTVKATTTDGKGGVFWHTQGSGKSLSMVFYAHGLQTALDSPIIVVITDRNNLDDQLYGQFARCRDFLRQTPQQAQSRQHLKDLLAGRQANGIIFTTMQKFEEGDGPLSERRNIVVMADEAHRGQYGLSEKVVVKQKENGEVEARTVIGTARIIRDNLPNATFIGFTGTPISSKERSTREVFGDYIDVYDMTQAVEDGATRPVYYESRVIHLKLDEATLRLIDAEYDLMARNAAPYVIEQSKKVLGQMEAILGADTTIESLVNDILDHYENYRANLLTGKAMIVAYSRPIAMKIYKRILELRPAWTEKVGVVMTQGNNDPEEWRQIIGNKAHKEELARKFKDNTSPMKIAIVVDMWLTGFDVPSLATMYVYKPMAGHNLMQAIARVNRVFGDKEGGLVVDYVGIAQALKQAMSDYTGRDKENYGNPDVGHAAYPKFLEKLSVCRDLFHGFDYSAFLSGTDLERAKAISGGVNFLLGKRVSENELPEKEKTHNIYIKEALLLRQALSLCGSMVDEHTRLECAFFEAVRTMVVRLTMGGAGEKFTLPEVNAKINELLKHSIKSEGVINLFSDVGTEFSLFDPKFLEEVANMKETNLAIELLKKLIAEQVSVFRRTNVVKSEKFSEIIQSVMNRYLNGMLTNEEVIQKLLKLAQDIAQANAEGETLGLTAEELAFYDALTKPQAIKDFYEHEELIALTKELTELLQNNRTIDWQKKESARAGMRRLVKRLLKKHKYPPEGMEDAVQTVMSQCEMWTDNVAANDAQIKEMIGMSAYSAFSETILC